MKICCSQPHSLYRINYGNPSLGGFRCGLRLCYSFTSRAQIRSQWKPCFARIIGPGIRQVSIAFFDMSFLSPIFLLGAMAAAIPVIVHLVRRTRAVRVPFASLMFLRRIEQKTVRRRHLRNWLLLLMRCAALLLLSLAFARPYFTQSNPLAAGGAQSSTVILIDTSYSMRYPGVFDRARQAAREIINRSSTNEQLALVSFSQSYEIVMPLKTSRAEASALLDSIQPGLAATDYLQSIQAADAILKDAPLGARKVYLISDFQDQGWNRSAAPSRLSAGIEFIPKDVSDASQKNICVTDVKAEPVIYQQKYPGKIIATVANFSPDSGSQSVVDFKINDLVVERREIELDPTSSQTVEFSGFNVTEGSNRATIEVTQDALAIDNKFYFTLRRDSQTRVLVIETPTRGRSETFFIQQALGAGDNSQYALTVKTAGSINPVEIDTYAGIIINDTERVSEQLAAAIRSYVERGGGVIIATGKHTDADEFNRAFETISPAKLGEAVHTRSFALMSQVSADHPIFNVFARGGRLASTRIFGYRRATVKEGAQTIAALDDGSPLIVEGSAGRGKVLLIATTLDTAWNDLPVTQMFLPMLRRMLEYLSGERNAAAISVGQALAAAPDRDGSLPAIDSPAGGRLEARSSSTGEATVEATEIGFYRLRYRDRDQYAAVNLDTRESDLKKLDMDEFARSVTTESAERENQSRATGLAAEDMEARQRLWLPLLIAALALFVGEAILARRIRIAKLIG